MKKILNNKGYMLVEIIVSSVIALTMAYFLMEITIKMVNKNNDYYVDNVLFSDKLVVTKEIMDDINNKALISVSVNEVSNNQVDLIFNDGSKSLIIDTSNKSITYGSYKKKLSDELNISGLNISTNNNILTISFDAYTNYSNENYGINIVVPYNNDITTFVYPITS